MKDVQALLEEARNIYDILVSFYELIDDEGQPSAIHDYYCNLGNKTYGKVNFLLDALLNDDISFKKFKSELSVLLERMQDTRIYVYVLLYFDQVFRDREQYSHLKFDRCLKGVPLFYVGPLNLNQQKYRLYLMPKDHLLKVGEAYHRINYRHINRGDPSDIFSDIDSYKIIRNNVKMYEVTIKSYEQDFWEDKAKESIRVAVIPLDRKKWFRVQCDETGKRHGYFNILDETEKIDRINQKYKDMIDRIYQENIDIAVFPELSMNRKTEAEIKKYLAEKAVSQPDGTLKLLFMGSLWDDGKNECVLFSGNGSVLLRNQKRSPFSFQSKGKEYRENLKERTQKHELLDVEGLGRILYVICKDDLDDLPQVSFWNEYKVGMEIISAFSASVSYFVRQMKRFAEDYLGVSLLANSCEPRSKQEETDVGYLMIPAMRKKPPIQTEGVGIPYQCRPDCIKSCQFCHCMHIFELNTNQLFESEEKKHMIVSYTSDTSTALHS